MTEAEAKTKWCARSLTDVPCTASACMAWRETARIAAILDGRELIQGQDVRGWGQATPTRIVTGGYCGLAGVLT